MKVWTKIRLNEHDKNIDILSNAMTNYLYKYGPIVDVFKKYGVTFQEKKALEEYTASRIAGILTLYMADDKMRIHDIVNKYYSKDFSLTTITPELEGYIERTRSGDNK